MKKSLIFATSNIHKLEEVRSILGWSDDSLQSLKDISWNEEIEETGDTLEENALIKSRTIYSETGRNVFSDDSGLEVIALGMAPGVHTARYAGPHKNADDNMDKLLDVLKGEKNRRARFRAVVALIWEGKEYLFEGIVNGLIAYEKLGTGGFGYDPIFIPEGYDQTFAQLDDDIKNGMSHRYRSIDKMRGFLEKLDS
ncbi:MAG: RdgB/HAM1 family non-canonical purine NTP pyrophosphatase [Saprospiraceae bacterium]|nr:RdgB/HAM1 family non-canonical purine NTP pyrophosphatase [Saprospiraceae bacterium]